MISIKFQLFIFMHFYLATAVFYNQDIPNYIRKSLMREESFFEEFLIIMYTHIIYQFFNYFFLHLFLVWKICRWVYTSNCTCALKPWSRQALQRKEMKSVESHKIFVQKLFSYTFAMNVLLCLSCEIFYLMYTLRQLLRSIFVL